MLRLPAAVALIFVCVVSPIGCSTPATSGAADSGWSLLDKDASIKRKAASDPFPTAQEAGLASPQKSGTN
ncbi:MAG: hypothetical protein D6741_07040 [Planctomycetota bacterium]|nr:MAG: hypothetical protein D6741_07040 [Planctomycetota bacterium]